MEEKRSYKLLKYYWKVVVPTLMQGLLDAGWERELIGSSKKTHHFIKELLLQPFENINESGFLEEGECTTTITDNKIFKNYIEDIQRIAAMYLNVYIPDPNEITLLNFD